MGQGEGRKKGETSYAKGVASAKILSYLSSGATEEGAGRAGPGRAQREVGGELGRAQGGRYCFR